ncbi:hypothetical protein [Acidipila sp. EB88]|uniref:hypothetical protein n=1 Tax=Acidipila sp. EB88 TaxID=2305226 RepID=UPI000F5E9D43|nr:hypothetical protein [Acidipila sp. EB88]RRA49487.1 hypothetical protein D1Y84_15615 [Acidipila sp. EB88]
MFCFVRSTRLRTSLALACLAAAVAAIPPAHAAQLSTDAQGAIPKDVQQLIVVDYRAMQNSQAAMDLKARVMPPELKELEKALVASGIDDNHDVEELAFASFHTDPNSDSSKIVGVAQGQFSVPDILAGFRKRKVKVQMLRANKMYPMAGSGMLVCFVNPTTMVFGSSDAIKYALNARDGFAPSMLANQPLMQQVSLVDTEPLWSVLDGKGTQLMMRSVMGQAAQLADFESVRKRLISSRYSMNFNNGVKFNLAVVTPDTFTAATMSSMMNAGAMYEKMSGTSTEKQAIDGTDISSNAGTLNVNFNASDSEFGTLLHSSLFQSVVH